ncbi:electron transfer flavoprotein subunit beta [Candidatus Woesearchaeota archaeon]|nr:electron transfer flavoprotein subunit beta [Candidatus Woesearchaeota archaeon]
MNIVVCIKQVPDTTKVKTDQKTGRLIRKGVLSTINPFDMYALEEALVIKEKYGVKITVLSMGPPQAKHCLEFALSMGCDEAYLVSDRKFAGADTLATSYTIGCAIKKIKNFDLVLCGLKTIDGDTGQVGAGIAEFLKIPVIYYVDRIKKINQDRVIVRRELDDRTQTISSKLPCVISVLKGQNIPRMPSMKTMIESRNKKIKILTSEKLETDPDRIGLEGSPTNVLRVFEPGKKAHGKIIRKCPEELAEKLCGCLKKRSK